MVTKPANVESKSGVGNGFLESVCGYFRDFLETDFKRQPMPKRQIGFKDSAGNLVGVALSRYPTFVRDVVDRLNQQVGADLRVKLSIPSGSYKSTLKETVREVIAQEIQAITQLSLSVIADEIKVVARDLRDSLSNDPETYQEKVFEELRSRFIRRVAAPSVKRLEKYFEVNATDGFEVAYCAEDEIADRLVDGCRSAIGTALAAALVRKTFQEFDRVVDDATNAGAVKQTLKDYFEGFATSDLFQDMHDLNSTMRLKENVDLYMYIGEIRFNRISFPLFYLPIEAVLENRVFKLSAGPRIQINKRALEFVRAETERELGRPISLTIKDTEIIFRAGTSLTETLQQFVDTWCGELSLTPLLDLAEPKSGVAQRSTVSLTNKISLAVFDTSDEAIVNDYETILKLLRAGGDIASDFFGIIDGIISRDTVAIIQEIDDIWDETSIESRLVFESPVPLNEEQRKIMSAINAPKTRFVAIEGPPGTGKSHTISAIAFRTILEGKSVLVLSDKKEALDVVEDKISKVLSAVREGVEFKNPILRIGASGSSYGEIVAPSSIAAIRTHHRATSAHRADLDKQLAQDTATLTNNIRSTVERGAGIQVDHIASLALEEDRLLRNAPKPKPDFDNHELVNALVAAHVIREVIEHDSGSLGIILMAAFSAPTLDDLRQLIQVQDIVAALRQPADLDHALFCAFRGDDVATLRGLIAEYQELAWPIFKFLFVGRKARRIDERAGQKLMLTNSLLLHRRLGKLQAFYGYIASVHSELGKRNVTGRAADAVLTQLALGLMPQIVNKQRVLDSIAIVQAAVGLPSLTTSFGIQSVDIGKWAIRPIGPMSEYALAAMRLAAKFQKLRTQMQDIPVFDYAAEKARLENLHASRLASLIDRHLIAFADSSNNTLQTIRDILKQKKRFPPEQFDALKKAFPCMIASIRDYADYMPLKRGIFDVIIIDEASQVSIAQALPAFIRAKKVVVMGDRNQFSNVKTVNASIETNTRYVNDLLSAYESQGEINSATESRLKLFNIKTNVLEFVERIADYRIMLRKHFRGYPELISFSSKHFYRDQLQPMKIRGKPIEDVIVFQPVPPDAGVTRNINQNEAAAILEELTKLVALEKPPSVGIVTPFTEQQTYLSKLIARDPNARQFRERLALKIMTFDTCQGEERDIILYSLVATEERDRLAYIFPSTLAEASEVDHVLRLQRLNVGFSRAKERVHFFHSKPLNAFKGSIASAVNHFLEEHSRAKRAPQSDQTDPSSPMEKQVLHWLMQTNFCKTLGANVEIDPQFELGAYLKQIDKYYKHPAYRVDFLIKVRAPGKLINIIVEYDGFKEHFHSTDEVNRSNYGSYYKPEDVERQKILEGYGYRFLRINRFNIGKDPVRVLDTRLAKIAQDAFTASHSHRAVEAIREAVSELEQDTTRKCRTCGRDRPSVEFANPRLVSGYNRICRKCREESTAKAL